MDIDSLRDLDALRERTDGKIEALDRLVSDALAALDRHVTAELAALRRETHAAQTQADKTAAATAEEAKERLAAHNGLIELMRAQAGDFVRREVIEDFKAAVEEGKETMRKRLERMEGFQAKLIGGGVLLGLVGVGTLVQVWTGG